MYQLINEVMRLGVDISNIIRVLGKETMRFWEIVQ